MTMPVFERYFDGMRRIHLVELIELALAEDGPDVTSDAIFSPHDRTEAVIVAKAPTRVAGLPLIELIFTACARLSPETDGAFRWHALAAEGEDVLPGQTIVRLSAATRHMLRAERVILNMISRASGIATLTRAYVAALEGTGVRLLDTRKTQPGMRGLDKYAVAVGGGCNHRFSLADMAMLKDNHIDAAGSITAAVARLREHLAPGIAIEVECRTPDDVREAVTCGVERLMLDNMGRPDQRAELAAALALIPEDTEAEISGNVDLDTIRDLALVGPRRPDFISVGKLTHSVIAADLSLRCLPEHATGACKESS